MLSLPRPALRTPRKNGSAQRLTLSFAASTEIAPRLEGTAVDDKDAFAVWIAHTIMLANNDEFGAAALLKLSDQARSAAELDKALGGGSANRRPGDFGAE